MILKYTMDYKNINNILQKSRRCSHENYAAKSPYTCDSTINSITLAITNNIPINLQLLTKYFGDLFTYYNSTNSCVVKNMENFKILINNIFATYPQIFSDFYDDNKQIFVNMLRYPIYDTCYEHLNTKMDIINLVDKPFLDVFVKRLTSNYTDNNDILANFIIRNVNMTKDIITKLSACKSELLANCMAGIIDKSNESFTDELLLNACSALPFTKQIVQSLVLRNVVITNEHIEHVIKHCSADSIEFIFNLANVQATKQHFKNLVTSDIYKNESVYSRQTIIYNKVICTLDQNYDLYKKEYTSCYTIEKCLVLLNHGFVPEQDDIKLSIEKHVEIPMIEKFGVVFDETFLKLLQKNKFYPNYEFKCIAPELYELQRLCITRNLPKIRKHMKKYDKLVPDSVCMENASKVKSNGETIDLLINAGGIVTKECINSYSEIVNDHQLYSLLEGYFKNVK